MLGRTPKDSRCSDLGSVLEELLRPFPAADQVGAHFGVVLVHDDGAQVEVATFRSDLEYQDGRHPVGVRFETDPRQDALRRDFTINGLFLDPVSGQDLLSGKLLDWVGGRADLDARLIRAIGDPVRRFREDHLRLLRAVRFAARLGFEIEPETMAAIRGEARSIHSVSAERVRDEIARILTEGGARRGFGLLDATGLLHEVLPEIEAMKGVQQPPEFHPEGDVWVHTLMMLEKLKEPSLGLALGVLLHDVGKPATFRVAERIRFDGHVEKGVELARGILKCRLRFPQRCDGAGAGAGGESHEVHGRGAHAGEHAEAFPENAGFRRAHGTASRRLPFEPRRFGQLRIPSADEAAGDASGGIGAAATTSDGPGI